MRCHVSGREGTNYSPDEPNGSPLDPLMLCLGGCWEDGRLLTVEGSVAGVREIFVLPLAIAG